MAGIADDIERYISSPGHLSKKHVHPRMMKLFELGGMNVAFTRGQGSYLYDEAGTEYLDFLAGGGVHFIGRNHPRVREAIIGVAGMDLPNLSVVNASVLGGRVAERLLEKAGGRFSKVIFANSGTEATDVCIRFARHVTGKRRFLHLDGSFHGRSYGAVSLCGFRELKAGSEPLMPTCTPIPPNDLKRLRQELSYGDVAGFIMEPVMGLTGTVLSDRYLREAEALCIQHGAMLIADEVQTGLCRTGSWFASTGAGVRPHLLTVSKALSGGQVPVSAVLLTQDVYEGVYAGLKGAPVYFSTFAENNLAMGAALATMDVLEEMDAPARAREMSELVREGLAELQERYDVIERIDGKGLMVVIYFKQSDNIRLKLEQQLLGAADKSAFAAAVNVEMFLKHQVLVQIPGPGVNAIKILPPVTSSDDDLRRFLDALEDVLLGFYREDGPAVSVARMAVSGTVERARKALPSGGLDAVTALVGDRSNRPAGGPYREKKKS